MSNTTSEAATPVNDLNSIATGLKDGYLCISNGCTSEIFDIVERRPKALKLHAKNLSRFPVWVPLAGLKEEVSELPGVGKFYSVRFANWFVKKMWSEGKPWQRVALGFSTY